MLLCRLCSFHIGIALDFINLVQMFFLTWSAIDGVVYVSPLLILPLPRVHSFQ